MRDRCHCGSPLTSRDTDAGLYTVCEGCMQITGDCECPNAVLESKQQTVDVLFADLTKANARIAALEEALRPFTEPRGRTAANDHDEVDVTVSWQAFMNARAALNRSNTANSTQDSVPPLFTCDYEWDDGLGHRKCELVKGHTSEKHEARIPPTSKRGGRT